MRLLLLLLPLPPALAAAEVQSILNSIELEVFKSAKMLKLTDAVAPRNERRDRHLAEIARERDKQRGEIKEG